jgi:hypothetical protein
MSITYTHAVVTDIDKQVIGFSNLAQSDIAGRFHVSLSTPLSIDDYKADFFHYEDGVVAYNEEIGFNSSINKFTYAAVLKSTKNLVSLTRIKHEESDNHFQIPLDTTISIDHDNLADYVYIDGKIQYNPELAKPLRSETVMSE